MKTKIIEHLLSIIVVTAVLLAVLGAMHSGQERKENRTAASVHELTGLVPHNANDPFEQAVLRDAMNSFYPGCSAHNDSCVALFVNMQERELVDKIDLSTGEQGLTPSKLGELFGMYVKFILAYVIVMIVTWYGVQTIAVWRYVRRKRSTNTLSDSKVKALAKRVLMFFGTMLLFTPAYVIAYAIRTELNTDTLFFMVALAVISNGVLITYQNKFFTFLVAEGRKGYVETAIVKNLKNSYATHGIDGISLRAILAPFKKFDGHVFGHIFNNAQMQYLPTIKEQASFLITGLIIIEMALNIHGHLCYELLRQILYKDWSIVVAIVLGIFYTVKMTEILVDVAAFREARKYEN